MSNLSWNSDSLETSQEILDAIYQIAPSNFPDENMLMNIWLGPTSDELVAIQEIVTKNGMLNASDFCWGAAGTKWVE